MSSERQVIRNWEAFKLMLEDSQTTKDLNPDALEAGFHTIEYSIFSVRVRHFRHQSIVGDIMFFKSGQF